MKSEYARSHRGFTATVAGLMVACFLSLATLAIAAPGATNTKNSNLPQKEAAVLSAADQQARANAGAQMIKAPLMFEANQGHRDSRVKFSARGQGYGIYLTESEMVLALRKGKADTKTTLLRMKLDGANPAPTVTALDKLDTVVNYFIGNDPKKWRTNVANYARVKYREVYPGIDLVYYGNQQQLEYDFIVAPGGDPRAVQFELVICLTNNST